jgi:hypothetical protein
MKKSKKKIKCKLKIILVVINVIIIKKKFNFIAKIVKNLFVKNVLKLVHIILK